MGLPGNEDQENIYTKTNLSLSLELILVLQGNAETEDHMLISGKGNLSVDSMFIHSYSTCI